MLKGSPGINRPPTRPNPTVRPKTRPGKLRQKAAKKPMNG